MRTLLFIFVIVAVLYQTPVFANETATQTAEANYNQSFEPDPFENVSAEYLQSLTKFQEPAKQMNLTSSSEGDQILSSYDYLDPQNIVPTIPLQQAVLYFDTNKALIKNQNYLTIDDFTQYSGHKRMYVIDMKTGNVETYLVAHGRNSDPEQTGYATKFSNVSDSKMSSVGFYLTAETYEGSNGLSMRLDGLQSTNSKARERAIVMHGAHYVTPDLDRMGRSWGCPAIEKQYVSTMTSHLKEGSLLYIWAKQ